MSDAEHLGNALRERLHALVEDVDPSAELLARVEAIPSARTSGLRRMVDRARPRRLAFAVPLPIAALAVGAVLVLGSSDVTPSYATAITILPNGDVRVTISQIVGVASANAELRSAHIHNMVVRPMSASCAEHPSMSYDGMARYPPPRITLTPRTVARGWTIVLAAKQIEPNKIEMAIGRFRGRLPRCVSSHGTGPGLGNWVPTGADRTS